MIAPATRAANVGGDVRTFHDPCGFIHARVWTVACTVYANGGREIAVSARCVLGQLSMTTRPRPGDIVLYEEHGLGYLLSSFQRSSHLTPLAYDTAIPRAETAAALHHVDAWRTNDGTTYEKFAYYRSAPIES